VFTFPRDKFLFDAKTGFNGGSASNSAKMFVVYLRSGIQESDFVFDGPVFQDQVDFSVGQKVLKENRWFLELYP